MYRDPKGYDRDWPTLRPGHSLVEESLRRVRFTDSLWEAGQVGVELPQDVCRPQTRRRSEEPRWRFNGFTGLCTFCVLQWIRSNIWQTYLAELSHCWCFYHRQCWKTKKQLVSFKSSSQHNQLSCWSIFPYSPNLAHLCSNLDRLSHLQDSPLYSLITNRRLSLFAPTPLAACSAHQETAKKYEWTRGMVYKPLWKYLRFVYQYLR